MLLMLGGIVVGDGHGAITPTFRQTVVVARSCRALLLLSGRCVV